jgi:CheY-like chemotaxis protein
VELRTGVHQVGEEELSANVARQPAAPGRYVVLTVADTGCGMDETTRALIFDPFFSTKFTGRGLGLSSVLGIVRGHKALLTVNSQPGAGTTFRVFFPISERRIQPQPAVPAVAPGEGTILVVDDEEVVRRMAKAALKRLGYSVLTAVNGREGLRLYREAAGAVDAVLLDMTMPVMGGEETLRRLLEINPGILVLAMSGFDEGEAKSRFGVGIAGFIQKPFTAAQLGAKIAAVRQTRRGAA